MVQLDLPAIHREVDGKLVHQRAGDGYINATAMCNAAGKKFNDYSRLGTTQEFMAELSAVTGIPVTELIQTVRGGNPEYQGSWIHPQAAINLAQWLSPKFAVKVSLWVQEWISGGYAKEKGLPVHIERYLANRGEIPHTHFSILNEITFALIAPLESDGYTLPENLIPDISEGIMFAKWLREEKGIDTSGLPKYKHRYLDGRIVEARLYPNALLADFRAHFNEVWLPQRAKGYFKDRDQKALPHLDKMLALPAPKQDAIEDKDKKRAAR